MPRNFLALLIYKVIYIHMHMTGWAESPGHMYIAGGWRLLVMVVWAELPDHMSMKWSSCGSSCMRPPVCWIQQVLPAI